MPPWNHAAQLSPEQQVVLGLRVRELRGHMARRELARRANVDEKTIRRVESGEVDPSLGTLMALARGLDLSSVEELLTGRRFGTRVLEDLSAHQNDSAAS